MSVHLHDIFLKEDENGDIKVFTNRYHSVNFQNPLESKEFNGVFKLDDIGRYNYNTQVVQVNYKFYLIQLPIGIDQDSIREKRRLLKTFFKNNNFDADYFDFKLFNKYYFIYQENRFFNLNRYDYKIPLNEINSIGKSFCVLNNNFESIYDLDFKKYESDYKAFVKTLKDSHLIKSTESLYYYNLNNIANYLEVKSNKLKSKTFNRDYHFMKAFLNNVKYR